MANCLAGLQNKNAFFRLHGGNKNTLSLIKDFSGKKGIRDKNLLLSALDAPKNDLEYNNSSVGEVASSYLFHICKNHPFIDGNKRVAFMSAKVFLEYNGYTFISAEEELYEIVISVANTSVTSKENLYENLRKYIVKK